MYTKVDQLGPGLAVFSDPGSATSQQQPGHEGRGRGTNLTPASWATLKIFLLWTAGLLVFPCREYSVLGLGRCLSLSFYLRLHLSFQHQPDGTSLSHHLLVLILFGQPELDVQFLCAKKDRFIARITFNVLIISVA